MMEQDVVKESERERIKLRAAFLNRVAIASLVAGALTVTLLNIAAPEPDPNYAVRNFAAFLFIVVSFGAPTTWPGAGQANSIETDTLRSCRPRPRAG
jgi:hypothetical protein